MTHALGAVLIIFGVIAALIPVVLGVVFTHQDHGTKSFEDAVAPSEHHEKEVVGMSS